MAQAEDEIGNMFLLATAFLFLYNHHRSTIHQVFIAQIVTEISHIGAIGTLGKFPAPDR